MSNVERMREFKTIPASQMHHAVQQRLHLLEKDAFAILMQLVELDRLCISRNEAVAKEAAAERDNMVLALNQIDERMKALAEFEQQLPIVNAEDNSN